MTDKAKTGTTASINEIDKALRAAQERKAKKAASGESTTNPEQTASTTPTTDKAPAKPKLSDEEKAAKQAAKDVERSAKKAERDQAREAKKAQRDADRKPAHLRKVQRAAERLSALGQAAQLLFNEATAGLSAADLASLALHIQHFNRENATVRALSQKLNVGDQVTFVGGDPRYIGKTGTVNKSQRIRCYIDVEGAKKPVYCFTSDVAPIAAPAAAATA